MQNRSLACPTVIIIALLGLSATGCTTAIKQAFYETVGARGEVLLNQRLENDALAHYESLQFSPARTELSPDLCPRIVIRSYDHYANEVSYEFADVLDGGPPTLDVASEVLFFEEKGLLGSAQLLIRVHLSEEDVPVADGLVNVESKSFRKGDAKDLAETAVETMVKLIRDHKEAAQKAHETQENE